MSLTSLTRSNAPFQTIALTAVAWRDDRLAERLARGKGNSPTPLTGPPNSGNSQPELTWRIWWDVPDNWREETAWPNGATSIVVINGDLRLAYDPGINRVRTNRRPNGHGEMPVGGAPRLEIQDRLDVFPLTSSHWNSPAWAFADGGPAEYLGRGVRRVRVTRSSVSGVSGASRWPGPWFYIDDYEALVDGETGILMQLSGIAEGAVAAQYTITDLRIDEPIVRSRFRFDAPPEASISYDL